MMHNYCLWMGTIMLLAAGMVSAENVLLTNGTFEAGGTVPVGWQISDGTGEWLRDAGVRGQG